MAYIGKTPTVGNFQKCDALTASATADYTLQVSSTNVVPESVNHMIVSLNGVIQQPGATGGFTVSGSTLSFTSALTSNDTIDFVMLLGNVLDIGTPSDDTVATAKIQDDAVTAAKINTDLISGTTALASEPADTDEFLVSDAGTLKRIDYSLIKGGGNTPAFEARVSSQQSFSQSTWTKVDFDTEIFDSDGMYDHSTNQRFTPTTAGKYMIGSQAFTSMATGTDNDEIDLAIYLNGSVHTKSRLQINSTRYNGLSVHAIIDMDGSSDYVEIYTQRRTGGGTGYTPYVDSGTSSIFWGYLIY